MFEQLQQPPEDALHGVMARCAEDPRAHKMDLGVGVYRSADGRSPIMRCVVEAQQLLQQDEQSKSYQALRGDTLFLQGMSQLVFGADVTQQQGSRIAAVQSVGGTGGVRLAIELALRAAADRAIQPRVFVGLPTWPNHLGICAALGAECVTYEYFDVHHQRLNEAALEATLHQLRAGDVFVLHGPCHNPTGADLSRDALPQIVHEIGERGAIPVIDAAYYGLGYPLETDCDYLRGLTEQAPEVQLVLSCSKAFGLYRERTGVLFSVCANARTARRVQGTLEQIARGSYSMPPAHGAGVVGLILDPARTDLMNLWREELVQMRERIATLRSELAARASDVDLLQATGEQRGIFSLLPLSAEQVQRLAVDHAIYLPASGRINIAGFKTGDIPRFVEALQSIL